MLRPQRLVSITFLVFAVVWCASLGSSRHAPFSSATLIASGQPAVVQNLMKQHFNKVEEIQDAVVRGDMESARAPARAIATEPPAEGLPAKSGSQMDAMKAAAQRAADAKDIRMVANATATMASVCGTCHRSSGADVKVPEPAKPAEGAGLAAHMREHDYAIDYLYAGLIGPSDEMWKKGAELLKGSPLAKEELPNDPKLTDDIKAYEVKVHQFAQMAANASDTKTRVGLYGELLAGCAECHSLYGKAIGPRLPKQ